jgi:squalene-hopene/tetraprenyl-beta-curcumene cyclase
LKQDDSTIPLSHGSLGRSANAPIADGPNGLAAGPAPAMRAVRRCGIVNALEIPRLLYEFGCVMTAPRSNESSLGDGRPAIAVDQLDGAIDSATEALLARQNPDGHWVFALEADATIPSEYIMLMHYLDEIDEDLQRRIADAIRGLQGADGGYPLFWGGKFDVSATVKAYYALKLAGDPIDAPHMARAREIVLSAGGAARCNVFTRIALSLFGQTPWRAVPVMPVEIMLLPRWFPFHLSKVSYWSRTVIVPLLILMALKPRARNPRQVSVAELFATPPFEERHYLRSVGRNFWGVAFRWLDHVLRFAEPLLPKRSRKRSIDLAVAFMDERLNGVDGLGAIFPAMANSVMAMDAMGYAKDDPRLVTAKESLRKLVLEDQTTGGVLVQPCVSPIWDTGLAAHAMLEVADTRTTKAAEAAREAAAAANRWLIDRQELTVVGDWADRRPGVRPGGWAFQYANAHYPDVDDTAAIALAIDRAGDPAHRENIDRAVEWVVGMQSANGGWGAFDADNEHYYLNYIPFADHGALLDPPTADVSARCISMLAQAGMKRGDAPLDRGVAYLWKEQEPDGSWYGRWGTNYVYGTWSALCALNAAGEDHAHPGFERAVQWLVARQRPDGGWGEDGISYYDGHHGEGTVSTASQTAWALLGLMAAGRVEHPAVARGVAFLLENRQSHGLWDEESFTAVGFPRVFYLRYHGYRAYFPLMALARFRNLTNGNSKIVMHGM